MLNQLIELAVDIIKVIVVVAAEEVVVLAIVLLVAVHMVAVAVADKGDFKWRS